MSASDGSHLRPTVEPPVALDLARALVAKGFAPVPLRVLNKKTGEWTYRVKGTSLPAWNKTDTRKNLEKHFPPEHPRHNVGILTGELVGNLVDVDLDCEEARGFAGDFLPPGAAIFGRGGKRTHYLYRSPGSQNKVFKLSGETLVELRFNGLQTMAPGSLHPDADEFIEWITDRKPATVDNETLREAVGKVAAACIITRKAPQEKGLHDYLLALAGWLAREKWEQGDIENFLARVWLPLADNRNRDTEGELHRAVKGAVEKASKDAKLNGYTTAVRMLGKEAADLISDALLLTRSREWIEPPPTVGGDTEKVEVEKVETEKPDDEKQQDKTNGNAQPTPAGVVYRVPFAGGPVPLTGDVRPGRPFPLDALPPRMREAAEHIAWLVQAPETMAAQSVLAAAALATQGLANVKMPRRMGGRVRPLSLFLACVAASGERKSSADAYAVQGIKEAEKLLNAIHRREIEAYEEELKAYKAGLKRASSNLDGSEDTPRHPGPAPRRGTILYGEPTIEGLTKSLQEAQPNGGVFSAEGARMVGGHAFKDDAKLRTLGTLCDLWDEGRTDRTRATGNWTVEGRLCFWLMMQPKVWDAFISDGMVNDQGFLARVLVAKPESRMGDRPTIPPPGKEKEFEERDAAAEVGLAAWAEHIRQLYLRSAPDYRGRLRAAFPAEGEAEAEIDADEWEDVTPGRTLTLAPEAVEWLLRFHDERKEPGLKVGGIYRDISGFAEKTSEIAARVASVLALVEDHKADVIDFNTMRQALRIVSFFLDERVRLTGDAGGTEFLSYCQKVLEWLHKGTSKQITLSAAMQYGPRCARRASRLKQIFSVLEEYGWIEPELDDNKKRYWVIVRPAEPKPPKDGGKLRAVPAEVLDGFSDVPAEGEGEVLH